MGVMGVRGVRGGGKTLIVTKFRMNPRVSLVFTFL